MISHRIRLDQPYIKAAGSRLFWGIIGRIAIIDIVFSLDSVITAVGMAEDVAVMVTAVVIAVGFMMLAAPLASYVPLAALAAVLGLVALLPAEGARLVPPAEVAVPEGRGGLHPHEHLVEEQPVALERGRDPEAEQFRLGRDHRLRHRSGNRKLVYAYGH